MLPRFADEERRAAFYALQALASVGAPEAIEGGVISVDGGALNFWREHRKQGTNWELGKVALTLESEKAPRWKPYVDATVGMIVTRHRATMEDALRDTRDE